MAKRRRRGSGLYLLRSPKTGIYQIRGVVLGGPVRKTTGTTDVEKADQIRLNVERELTQRGLHGDQSVTTFAEAANDYLDAGGESLYMKPLADYFGQMKLSEIKQSVVTKYIREKRPSAGPFVLDRQVYTPITAVLRLAARNDKGAVPLFTRPKKPHTVVQHAPDEWVTAFLAGCHLPHLKGIVWLMTTTGVRVSEACRLTWANIDLKRKTALVARTKTGKPRQLPLDDELVQLLHQLLEASGGNGRVFKYTSREGVNYSVKDVCRRLGIKYYSSHKFGRHAIATRMLNAGHTVKEVMDAVGWAQMRMVSEKYGHLEQSKVQKAMLDVSKGLVSGAITQTKDKRPPETPAK